MWRADRWLALQWPVAFLDCLDEARRKVVRDFDGEIDLELRQVLFGAVGYSEGERLANNFFPRSMMRAASKSWTRPSATSAKSLSISACIAFNSWS